MNKYKTSILLILCQLVIIVLLINTNTFGQKPNIILIIVDDMGYSDIGCYGGEIPTPNIDRLAKKGIRFTQFYNASRCCPTRASLLTGLYQHQTGIGHMTSEGPFDFDYGVDGYRGILNRNCVTIAEVLKTEGYHSYMTGKWHLGSATMDNKPLQRGFEKFYGHIRGAFNYFQPQSEGLMLGNEQLTKPDPAKYYSTDAFTDYAINFIEEKEDNNPFFLYIAYNAPHWPLHAKQEDVNKFLGKYMEGWDILRQKRFERQVKMGLFDASLGVSPRDENVRPWSKLDEDQKSQSDLRMAVYAAQVYSVDYNIGKLLKVLENKKILNNTLIMFLSDNGASAEPYNEFGGGDISEVNNPEVAGNKSVGRGWANLSNTPFRMYKNTPTEGGIATPFIAHWPNGISKRLEGTFYRDQSHIIDVMPTVIDITGAEYPKSYKNNLIYDTKGISLVPAFKSKKRNQHEYIFFEHENNCAVRHGDWKIISKFGKFEWELYNLKTDRNELNNVANKHPELVKKMADEWRKWALANKVIPKGNSENKGYKTQQKGK